MKFDLPLLNYKMRFSLWQVKMRAILAQSSDLDEVLDGFRRKKESWTADEKRKDRKALSMIQLHLSNDILQRSTVGENCRKALAQAGIDLRVQESYQ